MKKLAIAMSIVYVLIGGYKPITIREYDRGWERPIQHNKHKK